MPLTKNSLRAPYFVARNNSLLRLHWRPHSVGVRTKTKTQGKSFLFLFLSIRTYFVHFHTFSYIFKVRRTPTEFGPPVKPQGDCFFLLSDSIVNRYIGIMKNKYVPYWNQTPQQSQKFSFYCTIKDNYSPSPYLVLSRKNPSRKALVKFGLSSHQLRIETCRYEKIPRNERICSFCTSNKIEDENHFLLDYEAHSQIRDIFFSKLETKIPDFTFTRYFNISSCEFF